MQIAAKGKCEYRFNCVCNLHSSSLSHFPHCNNNIFQKGTETLGANFATFPFFPVEHEACFWRVLRRVSASAPNNRYRSRFCCELRVTRVHVTINHSNTLTQRVYGRMYAQLCGTSRQQRRRCLRRRRSRRRRRRCAHP